MTYKLDICRMQIIDDTNDLCAEIKVFDEHCSDIEIKTVISVESWTELSEAILSCLRLIHPAIATKERIPDYLHEQLADSLEVLEREILYPEPKGPMP